MDTLAHLPSSVSSPSIPVDTLVNQYEFRNFNEIHEYIGEQSFLIDILLEAKAEIEKIFGKNAILILDLVHFNDYPGARELFVRIATPLSANEAYPLLTRFEEEWWLDASDRADNLITFTLEYI
jgi:hypothetical protein